jgi:hypothetical protein
MKSVLMIAYWFPPEGNAAVYRPLRFVRHLHRSGWTPIVVSLETDQFERYDPELLSLVPAGTEIVRVRNRDPWQAFQAAISKRRQATGPRGDTETGTGEGPRRRGLRSRLRAVVNALEPWLYHPDRAAGWIRPAARAAAALCARQRTDVIWATGMPWSAFIAAETISRRCGVPYVLDFRSSWTLVPNSFEARRPGCARRWDRAVLRRLLGRARSVIFAYQAEAECYWRAYPGALEETKIHIIPNGYDGEIEASAAPRGERCTVLYAGTLSSYRYDTVLIALQDLKRRDPAEAAKLRLLFVGEDNQKLGFEAESRGLSDMIEAGPPTTYAEICRLQREAHGLLMLEREPHLKGHELLAGAKLFGYLKTGRPIVGVLPQGEAKRILRDIGVGASTVADADSPAEIQSVFRRLINAWSAGTLASLVPDPAACALFSAERQTAALARALDGSAAAEPFVPGRVDVPASLRDDVARRITIQAMPRVLNPSR